MLRWRLCGIDFCIQPSFWLMSALFLGHGQHYDKLMAANPKNPEKLREGDV